MQTTLIAEFTLQSITCYFFDTMLFFDPISENPFFFQDEVKIRRCKLSSDLISCQQNTSCWCNRFDGAIVWYNFDY